MKSQAPFSPCRDLLKVILAVVASLAAFRAQADSTPVHRYSFSETGGATVADSVGGSAWAGTLPNGGTMTNAQVTLTSSSSQYVNLPAGIVSTLSNFTISIWVKLNSTANWTRIFDFGNSQTVYMFLTPQNGSNGRLRYAITTSGGSGEQQINGTSGLSVGFWRFVAVTLNGTTGILYVDGLPVGTNNAMTLRPLGLGSTSRNYLGRSQYSDPYLNAAVDEFCIYNVALSSNEIATTYALEAGQYRTATIDSVTQYQTLEGLGGATAFYAGWITAHPYKQEIYTNAFAGLNLSMLRLGDWYRYQTPMTGFDSAASEIVASANRVLGHPVPVYMSSWAPPAFLKSNGQVANGGTIITNSDGSFAYDRFAQYWYDSVQAYKSNGVPLTWISIQNEPDWVADYDSCIFHPTEDTVNGTNYASYSKALDAVFQRLSSLPSPPKLLAPEVVHFSYNDLRNYAATMNSNSFYGVAHHLYGDSTDASSLGSVTNIFPSKPRFMTEYGVSNMIEQATILHNSLVYEQVNGYNYWSLVWPGTSGGLIQIENPWNRSTWTNAPPGTATQSHGWWLAPAYWSMKHYSYFINPGFKRVAANSGDPNVLMSAYVSPDKLRVVAVFINTNANTPATVTLNTGSFAYGFSSVYQTALPNCFQWVGAVPGSQQLTLPVSSLTTVVLDKNIALGAASNPSPTNGATGLAINPNLSWVVGSNAVKHAIYVGTNSSAVANATIASPEFQGLLDATNFVAAAPRSGKTYYWRVDEIAYSATNQGSVWSFSTMPLPAPWLSQGVGSVGLEGGAVYSNGVFTVTGSGGDVWGTADAFDFVYMPVSGDCTITARVASLQNIDAWSKGGVMIRESLAADARNAFIAVTPGNGVTFQYRSGAGGNTGNNSTTGPNAPYWVKLVRSGNTFNGYRSPDGTNWIQFGTTTFTMGVNALLGLALTSHNNSSLCTATFDNVTAPNWPPSLPAPGGLSATAGDAQVILSWASSTGATNYSVKRSTTSGGPYTVVTNVALTKYTDTGLINNVLYYYVVSALYTSGETTNSVQVSARPLASPDIGVSLVGTNLIFTWPIVPVVFTLQSRTNLTLGNWETVTAPALQMISNHWQIVLPLDENSVSTYYRLLK